VVLGTCTIENRQVDSRYVDYLKLADTCNSPLLDRLLSVLRDEERIQTKLELLEGGIVATDVAKHVELTVSFVNQMIEASQMALRNDFSNWAVSNNMAQLQQQSVARLPSGSYQSNLMTGIY